MALTTRLPVRFRQRCETMATEARSALGLRAFDQLSAEVLARHLEAVLHTPEQIPGIPAAQVALLLASGQWSAAVISRSPLQILLNPRHAPARQESNLMHELAHVLLEHDMIDFNPRTGLPQRRQKDEDEATYLGGCLQIPRRGLLWTIQKGMTVSQVAIHFGASEAMVTFRCNVTGLKLF